MRTNPVHVDDPKVPVKRKSVPKQQVRVSASKARFEPIKFLPCKELMASLRDIALRYPSKERIKAAKKELVKDLDYFLDDLVKDNSSIEEKVKDLGTFCKSLKIDLREMLQDKFKESGDEKKKIVILKALLVLENGSSMFIVNMLESGRRNPDYKLYVNFLASLKKEDLAKFISNMLPSEDSKIALKNLATALLLAAQDESLVFSTLKKNFEDLFYKPEPSNDEIEYKHLLLLAVIDNMKSNVTLEELKSQYYQGMSLYVLDTVGDLIKKLYPDSCDVLIDVEGAKIENLESVDSVVGIEKYAEFLGEEAVPKLEELLMNNFGDPVIVSGVCDALISHCGEKGASLLEEIIKSEIANDNPSLVLATVICLSTNNRTDMIDKKYDHILKRLFRQNDFDLEKALLKIHESSLKVALRPDYFLFCDLIKPSLLRMIKMISLESRLAEWIQTNSLLGRNSGRILLRAIELKDEKFEKYIGRFMSDSEKSTSLRKLLDVR